MEVENKPKQQSKPRSILKRSSIALPNPPDHNKHTNFNEKELEEYDKTRGQKMKIDEPKTPYHEAISDSEESDDEYKQYFGSKVVIRKNKSNSLNPQMLTEGGLKDAKNRKRPSFSDLENWENLEQDVKDDKKKKFEQLRKQHYKGEFKKILGGKAGMDEE